MDCLKKYERVSTGGDDMDNKINSIVFEDEFKVCPKCGYADGFHTMLKRAKDKVKWLFICPSCHAVYDMGFKFSTDNFMDK